MRAATLVRVSLVVLCLASIGVAGTTVVMKTAESLLGQTEITVPVRTADRVEAVQAVQADQLERQLRSYQVRLNPAGQLEGRVNIVNPQTGMVGTAREMTIAFLQDGNVVAETRPGLEGRFEIALPPGVYSVVGAGPDGYVAYGVQVLPAELTVDSGEPGTQPVAAYQEVVEELAIDSVAIPVTDLPAVASLARSNIPPGLLEPVASGPGAVPGEPIGPQYDAENPDRRKDVALEGHQVQIRPDGQLIGRVHRINQNGEPTRIRRLNVFLVQNNQVIAQAPVDELGTFSFFDVDEGVYSFVAAGMEGLAAFTMQAVSGPDLADNVADEIHLVAAGKNNMAGQGAAAMVGADSLGFALNAMGNGDNGLGPGGEPLGPEGGGAGGGENVGSGSGMAGGGGGAGGGGQGALAALLGAGIGAAIGYAAADDDDNNRVVSPDTP